MQDASAGRHPLHVARSDDTALSCGVSVCNFALIDNADSFEPAVRMLTYTAWFCCRRKLCGTSMVEQ